MHFCLYQEGNQAGVHSSNDGTAPHSNMSIDEGVEMSRVACFIVVTMNLLLLTGCAMVGVKKGSQIELHRISASNIQASIQCKYVTVPNLRSDSDDKKRIEGYIQKQMYDSGYFRGVNLNSKTNNGDLIISFDITKQGSYSLGGIGFFTMVALGILPIPTDKYLYNIHVDVLYRNELLFSRYYHGIGYSALLWIPLILFQPFLHSELRVEEEIITNLTRSLLNDIYKTGILTGGENKQNIPTQNKIDIIANPLIPKETKARNITISGQVKSELGISNLWINNKVVPLKDDLSFDQSFPLGIGSNVFKIKVTDIENHSAEQEVQVKRLQDIEDSYAAVSKLDTEIDNNIPKYNSKRPQAVAVIIGNKDYQKTKAVDFAINDADSFRDYCISVLGIDPKNIIYQENATKGDFETIFGTKDNPRGRLFNWASPESEVFVYYSGHGAPGLKDKQGYFVPVECDPMYVEMSGYPLSVFFANLGALPTKNNVVFIDACFSGSNIYENVSPVYITSSAVEVGDKVTLLSSSSGTEVSGWNSERLHGLFTYYLLRAFHDTKAVDKNNDRKVTIQELYAYVASQQEGVPYYARRNLGIEQTPTLQGKGTDMELFRY